VEEVVDHNDRYLVVAKLGLGGELAMKLEPRTRDEGKDLIA
jgi:hypothetical protein